MVEWTALLLQCYRKVKLNSFNMFIISLVIIIPRAQTSEGNISIKLPLLLLPSLSVHLSDAHTSARMCVWPGASTKCDSWSCSFCRGFVLRQMFNVCVNKGVWREFTHCVCLLWCYATLVNKEKWHLKTIFKYYVIYKNAIVFFIYRKNLLAVLKMNSWEPQLVQ